MLKKYSGVILTAALLILHLSILPRYGFTWDFHFHFFGGGKLLGIEPHVLEPRSLPFVEPDPRRAWTLPYGPLMSIPPVASYLFFHTMLHVLPSDVSYHIPIVVWGVLGTLMVFLFIKEAVSLRAGLFAALFLAFTPRYFGDLHNNMKDIPSAVMFGVNMWLIFRFIRKRRWIDLLIASIAFAAAFSVKINSIFIPVVYGAWIVLSGSISLRELTHRRSRLLLLYFLLAPTLAFIVWWMFWTDPIGQLFHAYRTFGVGTNNIEVLLHGTWYCSGSTVPWYYPFWYLAVVTPIPLLLLSVAGIVRAFVHYIRHRTSQRGTTGLLLILWLFVPLSRYMFPKIGVIDGIRHFEEVMLPIAALSGITLDWIWVKLHASKRLFAMLLFVVTVGWLITSVILYHPYQSVYFNELIGGTRGAFGKYDLDYWGTSQKEAVMWVNAHAPKNAKVHIVMAAAVAGQYLRPDLLSNLNKYGYDESDFVILLNRTSFLYRFFYAYEYLLFHRPTHTISVRGVPLTWIFDNRTNNRTSRQMPFWTGDDPCIIRYWRGEHL